MKKELHRKLIILAAAGIFATAVCAALLFYRILTAQIFDDLKAASRAVAMLDMETLRPETYRKFQQDGLRVTWIDEDGQVIFDSMADKGIMENHRKRPEFKQAFANGEGRAVRKSATSAVHTFYYAALLPNGTALRIGKASSSVSHLIWTMAALILCIGVGVFLACAILARHMASRIVEPIEKMAQNLLTVEEADIYEEMRPFLSVIKRQHIGLLDYARARQEFTANVSHELKTPLTAISGYAELITGGMADGADARHFAGEIYRSAERLQALINDIIKLSQLDDSSLQLAFEQLDLYGLAQNCIDTMQMQATKQGVRLCLEGTPVCINGNKVLIEELLTNLCSNGIRYNKRGGVVAIACTLEHGKPVLSVRDTGIGIPQNQQEHIFERFYRVDKSRSKATGGTGLGLAIVKHIVAQHGAQIALASEEGKGTEIKIYF